MQPKIVVIGSSNTDMVVKMPRLPGKGESIIGGEFFMLPGGKGANQAVAAARMGAQVTFVARLGADVFGDRALAGFQAEGINTGHIARDAAAASGVALIMVDGRGDNILAVAPGANAQLSTADVDRAAAAIADADAVVLQLEIPLSTVAHALSIARQQHVRTVLNPAPAQVLSPKLLAMVDVLTPNEHEAALLSGDVGLSVEEAASHLVQMGAGTVVATLGAEGAFTVGGDRFIRRSPGFRVQAVDTTAAGDAFTASLAFALARGDDMPAAVRFANAAGALTVTGMGAQPSLPTAAQVQKFMQGVA